LPGNDPITVQGTQLQFGLLNFRDAFEHAVKDFLGELRTNQRLQQTALNRYREVVNQTSSPKPVDRELVAGISGLIIGLIIGSSGILLWLKFGSGR
jgi:hypothetical protein